MKTNTPYPNWNPKFKSMGAALIKKNTKTQEHYQKAARGQFYNVYDVIGYTKTKYILHFAKQQAEFEFITKYIKEITPNASWEAGINEKMRHLKLKSDSICSSIQSISSHTFTLNQPVEEVVNKISKNVHQYIKDDDESESQVIEKSAITLGIQLEKAQTFSDLMDSYCTMIKNGVELHWKKRLY